MGRNDLISRKALLERLKQEYKDTVRLIKNGETHLDSLAEGFTEVHNLIRDAPAVEAEPVRHGRWEYCGNGTASDFALCSMCGCGLAEEDAKNFDYCPYCGAKMDLQEE